MKKNYGYKTLKISPENHKKLSDLKIHLINKTENTKIDFDDVITQLLIDHYLAERFKNAVVETSGSGGTDRQY